MNSRPPQDVITPFTGDRFVSLAVMQRTQGRNGSPYATAMHGGEIIDASCLRGLGAYANTPVRAVAGHTSERSNARWDQTTVRLPQDAALFGPPDAQGLCAVRPKSRLGRLGWRNVPHVLLSPAFSQPYRWIVAVRPIAVGQEVLIPYRCPHINQYQHSTSPSGC